MNNAIKMNTNKPVITTTVSKNKIDEKEVFSTCYQTSCGLITGLGFLSTFKR